MNYNTKKAKLVPNSPEYQRVHRWVTKELGKAYKCSVDKNHTSSRYDWSNISREYKLDSSDWQQLCRSCHRNFDGITEDGRRRISEKNKVNSLGNTSHNIPIIRVEDNKRYKSSREAAKDIGVVYTAISNCLTGRSRSAGGYKWQYEGGVS